MCLLTAMIVKCVFDNPQKEVTFDCFRDVLLDVILLCCHDPLLWPVCPAHGLGKVITRIFCVTFVLIMRHLATTLVTFACLHLWISLCAFQVLGLVGGWGVLLSIVLHSDYIIIVINFFVSNRIIWFLISAHLK